MILINLLPHREDARRRRRQNFHAALGLAVLAGLLGAVLWYTVLQQLTAAQQARNGLLQAEIGRLDAQIKEIADLRGQIDALKARQKAVEDLQTDRNIPVGVLGELVRLVPEGVQLTALRQNGEVLSLNGTAQSNERVSELLRNLLYGAQWLERPELVEIKLAAPPQGGRDLRRLFDFALNVHLRRPQLAGPPGAGTPEAAPGVAQAASAVRTGAAAAVTSAATAAATAASAVVAPAVRPPRDS